MWAFILAQKKGRVPKLPKDINKYIARFVEMPKLLQYCSNGNSLLRYPHDCAMVRDCSHFGPQSFKILNVLVFGTDEEVRGINHLLVVKYTDEPEFFYHDGIDPCADEVFRIGERLEENEIRIEASDRAVIVKSANPSEFLNGVNNTPMSILHPRRVMANVQTRKSVKTAHRKLDVRVIWDDREHVAKIREVKAVVDPKCTVMTKGGSRCSRNAKVSGKCMQHAYQ